MMELTDSPRLSADKRPISDYFHSMFLSYELKAYKPDEKIFRLALERDGILADETLFIDDAAKNIEGARRLGIHGLHVATNADWRPALTSFCATGDRLAHRRGIASGIIFAELLLEFLHNSCISRIIGDIVTLFRIFLIIKKLIADHLVFIKRLVGRPNPFVHSTRR